MSFKLGDKVKLLDNARDFGSVDNGSFFGKVGVITDIEEQNLNKPDYYAISVTIDGSTESFRPQQLTPVEKNFDNLSQGDILIFNHGRDEYIFQGYVGDILFYTTEDGASIYSRNKSVFISKGDVQIKQDEEPITELTMDEVAKLAGVSVESLRIKKETV